MAARQKGHCGAWSGMLQTAFAHAMHILHNTDTAVSGTFSWRHQAPSADRVDTRYTAAAEKAQWGALRYGHMLQMKLCADMGACR